MSELVYTIEEAAKEAKVSDFEKRRGKRTHGLTGHPLFYLWKGMRQRCENPKTTEFRLYGGRGIKVCERWQNFANFLADMGDRPSGASLDRINNDGNYEPGNCRWATPKQQGLNTRKTWKISYAGETMSLRDWAARLGMSKNGLKERLAKWPLEKALTVPPESNRGRRRA